MIVVLILIMINTTKEVKNTVNERAEKDIIIEAYSNFILIATLCVVYFIEITILITLIAILIEPMS